MSMLRTIPPPAEAQECRALWRIVSPADFHAALWMQEAFGAGPDTSPQASSEGASFEVQVKLNPDEARHLSEVAFLHLARNYPGEPFVRDLALARTEEEVRAVLDSNPGLPPSWREEYPLRLQQKARMVVARRVPGNALLRALALADGPLAVGASFANHPSVNAVAETLLALRRESGQPLPGTLTLHSTSARP
jgi:hypothetical protein